MKYSLGLIDVHCTPLLMIHQISIDLNIQTKNSLDTAKLNQPINI